jgi:hypothetical protein
MKNFIWKLKMLLMKLRYLDAGHYERMCLAAGYKRSSIDYWLEEEKKIGAYASDAEMREDLCETEVSYWEE